MRFLFETISCKSTRVNSHRQMVSTTAVLAVLATWLTQHYTVLLSLREVVAGVWVRW